MGGPLTRTRWGMMGFINTCHAIWKARQQLFTSFTTLLPSTMSSAMPAESQATLRQRRVEQRRSSSDETVTHKEEASRDEKRDEVVWGKTPGGEGTWSHISFDFSMGGAEMFGLLHAFAEEINARRSSIRAMNAGWRSLTPFVELIPRCSHATTSKFRSKSTPSTCLSLRGMLTSRSGSRDIHVFIELCLRDNDPPQIIRLDNCLCDK